MSMLQDASKYTIDLGARHSARALSECLHFQPLTSRVCPHVDAARC